MSRNPAAHRAEFSVRCACGIVYKSDDSHIGGKIKCRCGRTVVIARPKDEYVGASDTPLRRRKRRSRTSVLGAKGRRVGASLLGAVAGVRDWFRVAWLEMSSYRAARRWTARLAWAWSALVVVTWVLLFTTSEKFLPATLLAYGPRFVLLAPFVVLIPLAAIVVRRALVPLTVALVIVLVPIMGGRISYRTIGKPLPILPVEAAMPNVVRVLTYNTQGGRRVAMRLRDALMETRPDVIALQECGNMLWDSLQAIKELHSRRSRGLCTASRWPITSEDSMPRAAFERLQSLGAGGSALVMRYEISTPLGPLMLVNLHLETARKGLESLVGSDGFVPDGGEDAPDAEARRELSARRLSLNAQIRERESAHAARWAFQSDTRKPVIVVGDFNLPVESTIFRQHWGDFTDAFDASGTGFGWTKQEGALLRIRIDHILVSAAAPQPIGAWLGPNLGSDHLPVIADLAWQR